MLGWQAFGLAPPSVESILALTMHLLLSGAVLILIIRAWRSEWSGGVIAFALWAFFLWTKGRAVPWHHTEVITGGLPVLGLLYVWGAERHRVRPPRAAFRPSGAVPLDGTGEVPGSPRSSGVHRTVDPALPIRRPSQELDFIDTE